MGHYWREMDPEGVDAPMVLKQLGTPEPLDPQMLAEVFADAEKAVTELIPEEPRPPSGAVSTDELSKAIGEIDPRYTPVQRRSMAECLLGRYQITPR
jgi:hypothetical protein